MLILIELIDTSDIINGESIIRIILGVGLVGTEMDWVTVQYKKSVIS